MSPTPSTVESNGTHGRTLGERPRVFEEDPGGSNGDSASLKAHASALSEDVRHLGGRLELTLAGLVQRFRLEELSDDSVEHITAALSAQGVRTSPTLARLFEQSRVNGTRAPVPAAQLNGDRVVLTRDVAHALEGLMALSIPIVFAAAIGYWVYGLALGVAASTAALVLWRKFDWLDQRLPARVPRGRALGAIVLAAVVALVGITVVSPIRGDRTAEHTAERRVQIANMAIDRRDVQGAQDSLVQAIDAKPDYVPALSAQIRLVALQQVLLDSDHLSYDAARRLAAAGHRKRAIARLRKIGDYPAAAALLARLDPDRLRRLRRSEP